MVRKTVAFISIIAFLNLTAGCTTTAIVSVPREKIPALQPDSGANRQPKPILRSMLVDGAVLVYDREGGRYREIFRGQDSVVVGIIADGSLVATPLRDIDSVNVEEAVPPQSPGLPSSVAGWALVVVGVGVVVALAIGVSKLPVGFRAP